MSGLRSALLFKKSYSFLVALSLCCCVQAFASSRKWGPLWLASGGLSLHWRSLWRICSKSTGFTGWGMWAQQFWGKNSLRCCVASSPTRDQTHAPCIAWQVPIHCTTRGVLPYGFMLHTFCILVFHWTNCCGIIPYKYIESSSLLFSKLIFIGV